MAGERLKMNNTNKPKLDCDDVITAEIKFDPSKLIDGTIPGRELKTKICSVCGKRFKNTYKKERRAHIESHSGEEILNSFLMNDITKRCITDVKMLK